MISFTIDNKTYQTEEGMTWAQWCNSEYNTYKCCTLEGSDYVYNNILDLYVSGVSKEDTIANQAYVTDYVDEV